MKTPSRGECRSSPSSSSSLSSSSSSTYLTCRSDLSDLTIGTRVRPPGRPAPPLPVYPPPPSSPPSYSFRCTSTSSSSNSSLAYYSCGSGEQYWPTADTGSSWPNQDGDSDYLVYFHECDPIMDMEIQKVEEPDESSNLNESRRGPSNNRDDEISETSYEPEEIKPYACCWNTKKPTTPEQRKGKRYACVSLVAVVCFLISDISLHVSNSTQIGSRSPQDVCLGILLRAFVQILVSLILGCTKRQFPWGKSGFRVLLIFVGAVTTTLIISIDISGDKIPRLSSSLVFMLVPTFTWIFSMTLALERFNAYVIINLVMYILAAVLLTQPQVLFSKQPAQVAPILSMDVGFSWPISVVPLNVFNSRDAFDVIGILATLMVAVITGYLMVLIHISKGQHWSVVGVWMGVGSIFGCAFYYWNHIGFTHFQWPSANAALVGASGISAIFGTLGALLYLMVLQNVTPTSALLIRCSEWAMVYIFQLIYNEKIFNVGDLSACILMTLASANIILSLCCF